MKAMGSSSSIHKGFQVATRIFGGMLLINLLQLLACYDDVVDEMERCMNGQIYYKGKCIDPNADTGISDASDAGYPIHDTGLDVHYPDKEHQVECNTKDEPNCWTCYEEVEAIYCIQVNPLIPAGNPADWQCWDTNHDRYCQRPGTIEVSSPAWTCTYENGNTTCKAIDPNYPDPKDIDWKCYDNTEGRHCYYPFCVYGVLEGYLCDEGTGHFLPGAQISIPVDSLCVTETSLSTTADASGFFRLENIPKGQYLVSIEGVETYTYITVENSQTIDYPGNSFCSCAKYGAVKGRICNNDHKKWTPGATVNIQIPAQCGLAAYTLSQSTNENGHVVFDKVPEGNLTVEVSDGDYARTEMVTVSEKHQTEIEGNDPCQCNYGDIAGQVCVYNPGSLKGEVVNGGTITLEVPEKCGRPAQTLTEEIAINGYFSIEGVLEGEYVIVVRGTPGSGIYYSSLVTLFPNQSTEFYGDNSCLCPINGCQTNTHVQSFEPPVLVCNSVWTGNADKSENSILQRKADLKETFEGGLTEYQPNITQPAKTAVDTLCNVWVSNQNWQGQDYHLTQFHRNCDPAADPNQCIGCGITLASTITATSGIAIDSYQQVWLGASKGIAEAGGTRYEVYHIDSPTCQEIEADRFSILDSGQLQIQTGNYSLAIYNDLGDDILWISHLGSAVSRYNITTRELVSSYLPEYECYPLEIAVDRTGRAWVSSTNGGLCRISYAEGTLLVERFASETNTKTAGLIVFKNHSAAAGERDLIFVSSDWRFNGLDTRIDAYDLSGGLVATISGTEANPLFTKVIGLDYLGNLWTTDYLGGYSRLTYDAGLNEFQILAGQAGNLANQFTSNDLTGYPYLAYAAGTKIRNIFNGGPGDYLFSWKKLVFSLLPESAVGQVRLRFRFRTGTTMTELETKPWIANDTRYQENSEIDLTGYGLGTSRLLEVETFGDSSAVPLKDLTLSIYAFFEKY